jgi:hypothetical protein
MDKSIPRIRIVSRGEAFAKFAPQGGVPLFLKEVEANGQSVFEKNLKRTTGAVKPPMGISLFELHGHFEDVWERAPVNDSKGKDEWQKAKDKSRNDATGQFTILRVADIADRATDGLIYVDLHHKEWGPLVSPASSEWRTPPYRFGAIFFVPLSNGGRVWLRLEKREELRICHVAACGWRKHMSAFRAAPTRPSREGLPPTIVRFLSVTMFHCFSDGNSYLPLAQDLFDLYEFHRGRAPKPLPQAPEVPFAVLERRLFDTFYCRSAPSRASLRGSLFRYNGRGYSHGFCFENEGLAVLTAAAERQQLPIDVALLGLVVGSLARADASEVIEYTLYAPMRDGATETSMIGLFSDWRDMSVSVDKELATVLATFMQIYETIQRRDWKPFNALRKCERTLVNIQPLDMQSRSHFQHLGENLWHGGDRLSEGPPQRAPDMDYARQPVTVNIEQQDDSVWWILLDVGCNDRPTQWMRHFSASIRYLSEMLVKNPLAKVHEPLPKNTWL